MKKIMVLFGAIALLQGVSPAYILESDSSNVELMKAQGFSRSTLQAVDWVNARNQAGSGGTKYVRRFTPKEHNVFGKAYFTAKEYIDPIQDDGIFGDRQIEFSNTWLGDETRYSSNTDYSEKL